MEFRVADKTRSFEVLAIVSYRCRIYVAEKEEKIKLKSS